MGGRLDTARMTGYNGNVLDGKGYWCKVHGVGRYGVVIAV